METEKKISVEKVKTSTFGQLLHNLDERAMKVIDVDAKKLKTEAQKIARIKQKINEEEGRYSCYSS